MIYFKGAFSFLLR